MLTTKRDSDTWHNLYQSSVLLQFHFMLFISVHFIHFAQVDV